MNGEFEYDEVVLEVEKVKVEWEEAMLGTQELVYAIKSCGKNLGTEEENSFPRLNASAQDNLAILRSLLFKLDLLAQQMPTEEGIQAAMFTLKCWKDQYNSLHASLRSASLQAKANIIKAAQEERELLLGGGEESTIRRRNLQTKAGIISTSEGITESLRRTRQMMVQEVERSANTLVTFDESTSVLKKAESEYKGHRSLLSRTRNLLSTMQRQDILDRIIVVIGFTIFTCAVLYVVSKRIGLLKLQRKLTASIKDGTLSDFKLGFSKSAGAGNPAILQNPGGVPSASQLHAAHMHDEL